VCLYVCTEGRDEGHSTKPSIRRYGSFSFLFEMVYGPPSLFHIQMQMCVRVGVRITALLIVSPMKKSKTSVFLSRDPAVPHHNHSKGAKPRHIKTGWVDDNRASSAVKKIQKKKGERECTRSRRNSAKTQIKTKSKTSSKNLPAADCHSLASTDTPNNTNEHRFKRTRTQAMPPQRFRIV
jgi:hypothetical protein